MLEYDPIETPNYLDQVEAGLISAVRPLGISYVGIVLAIYVEDDSSDLETLLATVLDNIPDHATEAQRDTLILALQNAWNYFPHARHGGLSPAQVMARDIGTMPPPFA
jgi:hypothetical protein